MPLAGWAPFFRHRKLTLPTPSTSLRARLSFRPQSCYYQTPSSILLYAMRRQIARLLLVFFLSSTSAPMLQALAASPPHACCLRRLHDSTDQRSTGQQPRIHDAAKHDGSCCPPLTTSHSAQVPLRKSEASLLHSSELQLPPSNFRHDAAFDSKCSSRAPPIAVLSGC